ncbi:MAG: AAA family ATPase [Terriglobia bacterium]
MSQTLRRLTIEGFKSIRKLEDFDLRAMNVLIGPNGAGKSNFVDFFSLLGNLAVGRLQVAVRQAGGADRLLYLGSKTTSRLGVEMHFDSGSAYEFALVPTADGGLVFDGESLLPADEPASSAAKSVAPVSLGSGHTEAALVRLGEGDGLAVPGLNWKLPAAIYMALLDLLEYHFLDTSPTATVRRIGQINDNEYLRSDASNLAAYLYRIRQAYRSSYSRIRDVVKLAAPFFDDFKLRPIPGNEHMIQLEWLQKDSDYPFLASQLSDGTLRFICLATALSQPNTPSTLLFDEPELGLHPYALSLLAGLFKQVAARPSGQIIVSTQSAALLNEFDPEDVIVVEREQGESTFRRLKSEELSEWLKDYSLGELWQKNVLGGRPKNEVAPVPAGSGSDPGAANP